MVDPSAIAVAGVFGGLALGIALAGPSHGAPGGSDVRAVRPHPDAPPPGHTGGFGEPTCWICHAEFPLDAEGIRVALMGVPRVAEPGSVHRIAVLVRAEGTVTAGFQLTTRGPDGRQAGTLRPVDGTVTVTEGDTPAGTVDFAHQTAAGTGGVDRSETMWTVEWVAPREPVDVTWSVAGNSGNGDNSPFGDLVGTGSAGTHVR